MSGVIRADWESTEAWRKGVLTGSASCCLPLTKQNNKKTTLRTTTGTLASLGKRAEEQIWLIVCRGMFGGLHLILSQHSLMISVASKRSGGRWCTGKRDAWSRPIALSRITGGCLHHGPAQKLTGRAPLLVCRSLAFTPHFRRASSHKHHLFPCWDEPDSGDNVLHSPPNKPCCHYQSVNLSPVGFASILE